MRTLLLDFTGTWGGPHPGHFPGFFFCGPALFWTLLLGFIVTRIATRHPPRETASPSPTPPPATPSDNTPWPNLDPAPQPSEDGFIPKGKIEYF